MMKKVILLPLIALFFSGCVSGYEDVSIDNPNALVMFEKGYDSAANNNLMQAYVIYENGDCNTPKNAAQFTMFQGEAKERRVSATQPLVFLAVINEQTPTSYNEILAETCAFKAEFQPKSGGKYRIRQAGVGGNCKISVTDMMTGQTVSDVDITGAFANDTERKNVLGYSCPAP